MNITIDLGHGGEDVGASAEGMHEKNVVFKYGKLLARNLQEEGHNVALTRNKDINPSFKRRAGIADYHKSDAVISCHVNGFSDPQANGIETFYWQGDINYSEKGKQLATLVQENLVEELGWRDRGISGANFAILRKTIAPTILIEPGFITNPHEREYMKTCEYRNDVDIAVRRGLREWKKLQEGGE